MDTIFMEYEFPVSVQDIWNAITDKDAMRQWYFSFDRNFNLQIGQVFEWTAGEPGGEQWLHRGKFLDVVPLRKLSHSWEYPGYRGTSVIHWILEPVTQTTSSLLFKHEFPRPFDPDKKAFRRENFVAGWSHILGTALYDFLKK